MRNHIQDSSKGYLELDYYRCIVYSNLMTWVYTSYKTLNDGTLFWVVSSNTVTNSTIGFSPFSRECRSLRVVIGTVRIP